MSLRGRTPATAIPVIILKEGTTRRRKRDAQLYNIEAALIIGDILRTSLGPMGADKMLVDTFGDVTITSDGATILDEMDVVHPAAKILVEAAKAQDDEVGDGTTTTAVLATELLKKARELMDKEVHPTVIADGYKIALEEALKKLQEISIDIKGNKKGFRKVISTVVARGLLEPYKDMITDIVTDAVFSVVEKRDGRYFLDVDRIKTEKRPGGSVTDSFLVDGIALDKEFVHPLMPKSVRDAKIALLGCPLEVERTEFDEKIIMNDAEAIESFLEAEEELLKEMVDKIVKLGINVVFCQKGIDDLAQYYLAKNGISAVRRVKKSDMEKLQLATGGRIVNNLDDLGPKQLGKAGLVEERKIGGEEWIFVEKTPKSKTRTIIVRGGSQRVVDELERTFRDAINVAKALIDEPRMIAGGGAVEAELYLHLQKVSERYGGKEALAIKTFAEALKAIPVALAHNAGLDVTKTVANLVVAHERRRLGAGIDLETGKPVDMIKKGVVESLKVKSNAYRIATETAISILRIDDVIAAGKSEKREAGGYGGE